jgi:quercetin dioxygenase-like cupin family protein
MAASVTVSAVVPGEAAEALRALGLRPSRWSAEPGARFAGHVHPQDKVLYCLEGEIAFAVGAESWVMHPGDRLDLPADTMHTARAGPAGVTCVEAFRTPPPQPS